MYSISKGNLNRVEGDSVQYVYCPFNGKHDPNGQRPMDGTICGTWCALFEIGRIQHGRQNVTLHCGSAQYELVQNIQSIPKPKEEGSKQ